jgi:hypothetical protein
MHFLVLSGTAAPRWSRSTQRVAQSHFAWLVGVITPCPERATFALRYYVTLALVYIDIIFAGHPHFYATYSSQEYRIAMVVKIYGFNVPVFVICKELRIPYEYVPVNMAQGAHKAEAWLADMHPFGQVPVMVVRPPFLCALCGLPALRVSLPALTLELDTTGRQRL